MQYAIAFVNDLVSRLQNREDGQGLVEYALILFIVSIGAVLVLGNMSTAINGVFTQVVGAL